MAIYTKTGDQGRTTLADGTHVAKDNPVVEACGEVDHLNSLVGLLATFLDDTAVLTHVQNRLFDLGGCLASQGKHPFTATTDPLEKEIDRMMAQLPPARHFLLPGGSRRAALAHLCRTVCRTAERRVCTVVQHTPWSADSIPYLNRLSDYFYALARYLNFIDGACEKRWENACTSNKI